MEVTGQFQAPAALPGERALLYQLNRKLNASQNRSGRFVEEKNILPLPRFEPQMLGRLARSLAAIPTGSIPAS